MARHHKLNFTTNSNKFSNPCRISVLIGMFRTEYNKITILHIMYLIDRKTNVC